MFASPCRAEVLIFGNQGKIPAFEHQPFKRSVVPLELSATLQLPGELPPPQDPLLNCVHEQTESTALLDTRVSPSTRFEPKTTALRI